LLSSFWKNPFGAGSILKPDCLTFSMIVADKDKSNPASTFKILSSADVSTSQSYMLKPGKVKCLEGITNLRNRTVCGSMEL